MIDFKLEAICLFEALQTDFAQSDTHAQILTIQHALEAMEKDVREKCAQVADRRAIFYGDDDDARNRACQACAAGIRAGK